MELATLLSVWDGRQSSMVRYSCVTCADSIRKKDLNKSQMAKLLVLFPSLLEFLDFSRMRVRVLGDSFFFPAILVGPYIDYAEHTALIDQSR
jgi:hypothetical protein